MGFKEGFNSVFGGKKEEPKTVGEDDLDTRIKDLQATLADIQNNPGHPKEDLRASLGDQLTNLMESREKELNREGNLTN